MVKILIFLILFFLTSCQSAQDAFSLKKKSTSDEFLVEKKSPLVLPPDFEMLPVPQNQQKNDNKNNKEKEIKNLLTDNDDISNSSTQNNSEPSSLEKSILEKIK